MSSAPKDYFNTDHLNDGLKTKALRGAAVSIVSQASIFGIQILGTIVMARLLTPDDFGLVTMVLTVALLLGNIGENGFPEADHPGEGDQPGAGKRPFLDQCAHQRAAGGRLHRLFVFHRLVL